MIFKRGPQCAPWPQELKKSLTWIGLSKGDRQGKWMTGRRVKEALHIRMRKGEVMNVDAGLTVSDQWKALIFLATILCVHLRKSDRLYANQTPVYAYYIQKKKNGTPEIEGAAGDESRALSSRTSDHASDVCWIQT